MTALVVVMIVLKGSGHAMTLKERNPLRADLDGPRTLAGQTVAGGLRRAVGGKVIDGKQEALLRPAADGLR
jgi:hypothetical protein